MEQGHERTVEVFNYLLEVAHDNVEGMEQAASLARNPTVRSFFTEQAKAGEALRQKISAEARSFGEPVAESGSVVGNVHKAFTWARNSISGDSDKALLEEAMRRANVIAGHFDGIARDDRIPSEARNAATEALPELQRQQREIEGLADQYKDSSPRGTTAGAHFKLTDDDHGLLKAPAGATVLSAGASGTETWLERKEDTAVWIGIQAVAVATLDGGSLSVSITVGDNTAQSQDGPASIETRLSASQTVQAVVRAGERLAVKAAPSVENAQILRAVVWTSDLDPSRAAAQPASADPAPQSNDAGEAPAVQAPFS